MAIFGIIPARLHSTRFPKKLLALARGKTILQRTWENAKRCSLLDEVLIATDHVEIAEHIATFGGQGVMTSPTCQNGTFRLIEAIQKSPSLQKGDIIVNIQGDHPSTSPKAIEAVCKLLLEDKSASMASCVTPIRSLEDFLSPHVVKCVFDQSQNALYFSRAPIPYSKTGSFKKAYHHIGLYAYRTEFVLSLQDRAITPLQLEEDLEQLQVLEQGFRIKIALVDDPPFGIDTPQDLLHFIKYLNKKWSRKKTICYSDH